MSRGAIEKSVTVMRLMRSARESGWVDTERCSATSSEAALLRTTIGTSSWRGRHWPGWIPSSGGRFLLGVQERLFLGDP